MNAELTEREREVLDALAEHFTETDVPPTLNELRERLGWNHLPQVQRAVSALRRKGHIATRPHTARGITLNHPASEYGRWVRTVIRMHHEGMSDADIGREMDVSAAYIGVLVRVYLSTVHAGRLASGAPEPDPPNGSRVS